MVLTQIKAKIFATHSSWNAVESKLSIWLGRTFALISVISVCIWCTGNNTDEKFLGGVAFYQHDKVFNLHPMCMIISLLFCMGMCMTSFRDGWSPSTAKSLHLAFNLLAKVFMVVGLRAVYIDHDQPEGKHSSYHYRHFGSMHSWVGLTTSFLLLQQDFFGGISYLYPKFFRIPNYFIKFYKDYHIFLGKCAYAMGGCAMLTGIAVKNEFLRCSSSVSSIDQNPLDGYNLIPPGCQISQGIGLCVILTVFFILFGLRNPAISTPRSLLTAEERKVQSEMQSRDVISKDSTL